MFHWKPLLWLILHFAVSLRSKILPRLLLFVCGVIRGICQTATLAWFQIQSNLFRWREKVLDEFLMENGETHLLLESQVLWLTLALQCLQWDSWLLALLAIDPFRKHGSPDSGHLGGGMFYLHGVLTRTLLRFSGGQGWTNERAHAPRRQLSRCEVWCDSAFPGTLGASGA